MPIIITVLFVFIIFMLVTTSLTSRKNARMLRDIKKFVDNLDVVVSEGEVKQ